MQQWPDLEKTDSITEISRLKWTLYNGKRKIFLNLQTDTDTLNNVVYRYRNSLFLTDNERDLELTEYQPSQNSTYKIDSLKKETIKKAHSLVNKICLIHVSSSQNHKL